MQLKLNNLFLHKTFYLILFFLLSIYSCSMLAQNIYEDLEGRFSLELQDGWKLVSEKQNTIYTFKDDESGTSIIIVCLDDAKSRQEVFANQVKSIMISNGYDAPPYGTVVDMTMNNCQARWAEYPFNATYSGAKVSMYAFLGSMLSEDGVGVNFFSLINASKKDQVGEKIKHTFETLRIGDKSLSGVKDIVSVNVDFTKPPVTENKPASSTFKNELLSITLPEGWISKPGTGNIITTIKHEDLGSLKVAGKEDDDFGDNREEILNSLRIGFISQIPSLHSVKGPYEFTTTLGETLLAEELDGNITVKGESYPYSVLLVSEKNDNRGLGFMGMFSSKVKKEAIDNMLVILKSLK